MTTQIAAWAARPCLERLCLYQSGWLKRMWSWWDFRWDLTSRPVFLGEQLPTGAVVVFIWSSPISSSSEFFGMNPPSIYSNMFCQQVNTMKGIQGKRWFIIINFDHLPTCFLPFCIDYDAEDRHLPFCSNSLGCFSPHNRWQCKTKYDKNDVGHYRNLEIMKLII